MKTKIDLSVKRPDETVFPQLRKGRLSGYIYLFLTKQKVLTLSRIEAGVSCDDMLFGQSDYFTGSITLSND